MQRLPFHRIPSSLFTTALACASWLAGGISGQVAREDFNRANGPLPGWTAIGGTFAVANNALVRTDSASQWAYLVFDRATGIRSGIVEADITWNTSQNAQFGGVISLHPGAPTPRRAFALAKVQSLTMSTGFDSSWLYEIGGASGPVQKAITSATTGRMRMVIRKDAVESTFTVGTATTSVGPRTLQFATNGHVGVAILGQASIDNFIAYDAVLDPTSGTTPKIGRTYSMDLQTNAAKDMLCVGYLSLTSANTPIGDGRELPVAIDDLFNTTTANSQAIGLLRKADADGRATLTFPIPNDPFLIGKTLHAGAVAVNPAASLAIQNISNPLSITVIQ